MYRYALQNCLMMSCLIRNIRFLKRLEKCPSILACPSTTALSISLAVLYLPQLPLQISDPVRNLTVK